jgi:hypothetical protein
MESDIYQTLNQPMKRVQGMVQGDKIVIATQPLRGEGGVRGKIKGVNHESDCKASC